MKKFILSVCFLAGLNVVSNAQESIETISCTVNKVNERGDGVVSKKILLKSNSTPQVKLKNIKTEIVDALPQGVSASNSFEPDLIKGTERKKSVAFVNVPVFRKLHGKIEKLISFDIEVSEYVESGNNPIAQKPTGVDHSVLANGTWYKIGAPSRGVYKITYAFLQSLGLNPGSIDPHNIRIYGNGGTVLSERVDPNAPDDLIENAIYVSSTGNTFASNDYILFYANGPTLWTNDTSGKSFKPTPNYYEDQSYYFLNFDLGSGKRIGTESATGTADYVVTAVDDYLYINNDDVNLANIGKAWWGNKMNSISAATLTQTFPVNLGSVVGDVKMQTVVANVCDKSATINIKANSSTIQSYYPGASTGIAAAGAGGTPFTFTPPSGAFNIQYTYSTSGTGSGYIDYIRLNYRKQLQFQGGQSSFRDWQTFLLPAGQKAAYNIGNANANIKVWEVSDPLNPIEMGGSLNGSTYSIVRPGNTLREFIAFDGNFNSPVKLDESLVAPQDLHGLAETDFLIITPEAFLPAAERLATFHRLKESMKVTVVPLDKIYNEFSSGGQDIGGIRNFIKMFYDRAANESEIVKNVLFMGAASFDYKDKLSFNTNFVPTYQTDESITDNAYSSDDFFAFLDDGEFMTGTGMMADVGTGRIPAWTPEEALGFVGKIEHYASKDSYGPWKNVVSYVADDRDDGPSGMDHMGDCEGVSAFYTTNAPIYNTYKIYSDAYVEVATPSGGRYPMVNKAIDDHIYNGTFLMSYSGHGSPDRWADEAILTPDDYSNWTNKEKLPVIVTATCDFGRFDDPEHRSAGARLMINPEGGSIAMVTTTQLVYQYQNTELSSAYIKAQFSKNDNQEWRTLGEALMDAKNSFSQSPSFATNNRKYVVLGDPALKMEMPVHNVKTEKLEFIENGTLTETDTIKALGRYMLSGKVTDANDNVLTDFSGPVYVTIFDKVKTIQVANPNQTATPRFNLQTSVVAKIKGTVENGFFSVTFVAPKDINYNLGLGKVSYYANTDNTDASGLDTGLVVGSYNDNAVADNVPPAVSPYIDNEKFRDGGVTGPNPLLYVKLFDENGINVSGTSIGHDLVAILDGDVQNPLVMNNYYQTLQNDFSNGFVNFPLYNLPDGKHTLKVIAWDTYNNSGEGTVNFEVKNQDNGFISDIYNYPNPMTNQTTFVFQHNQEGGDLDVAILIYGANGALVKTIKQNVKNASNRTEIIWDGIGDNGVAPAKGIYFYKLNAKRMLNDKVISATAYQKLVMLR